MRCCITKRRPTESEIRVGSIITQDDETMLLIAHEETRWSPDLPWEEYECPICETTINWASQRWLVDIGGFRTHRKLRYFLSTGNLINLVRVGTESVLDDGEYQGYFERDGQKPIEDEY